MTAITKPIILDLVPAYLAGDCSEDTRRLIDEFAATDADLARMIRQQAIALPSPAGEAPTADLELQTLLRTKRLIHRQAWYLGLAILFTFIAFTYRIGPDGIAWTASYSRLLATLFALSALGFWAAYYRVGTWLRGFGRRNA
jgi:hypothetical protein